MWQQQEGKGDGATFENDIAIYGICLNLGDSDEGEFEVISTIQGSGKEDSTIERNKESRKGHWTRDDDFAVESLQDIWAEMVSGHLGPNEITGYCPRGYSVDTWVVTCEQNLFKMKLKY